MDSKWIGFRPAWSVFRTPLARQFHWFIEDVAFIFTISIFVLGVALLRRTLVEQKGGPVVGKSTKPATQITLVNKNEFGA